MKDYILLIYKVFWDVLVRWRKIREPNGKEGKLKMGKGNNKKIMADGVKPLAYNLGGQNMKRIVSFLVMVALFTCGIGLFSANGDVIVKTKDELRGKITGAKVIVCVGKDNENQLNVGCSDNQRLIKVDTNDDGIEPDAEVNFQAGAGDIEITVNGFLGKCYQKTAGDNEDTVTFTTNEIGVSGADKFAVLIGKDGYITQCDDSFSYNPGGENKVNDSSLQVSNKFTVKITTLEIGYKDGNTVKGINKTVGIDEADNNTKAISGFVDANGNRDLNGTSNTIFKFGEQTLIPTTDNNDSLQSPNRARLKTEDGSEAWFIPIVPNSSCNPSNPPPNDATTTFDIQISGYLKRTVTINCKDGQTINFSPYGEQIIVKLADSGAGAGSISCTVNANTACAEPLETTAKISLIKRARDNREIGIGTADAITSAIADVNTLGDNVRGSNFQGVNGLSFVATVGTGQNAKKYIYLAIEDKAPPAETCSSSASTVRAFEFLLKGYFYPKDSNIHTNNTKPTLCFDKATITKFGTDQVDIKFSDIAEDCTAGEAQICGKALDFSVKIDRIEDEFCQEIGIGSPSVTGAVSTGSTSSDSAKVGLGKFNGGSLADVDTGTAAGNTTFFSTELNGRPYIDTTNKVWYVPVPANAAGSGDFSIFINGYAKQTVSFNSSDFENFQNVTKTLQFGPESPNTNDVCQPAFYKCAERINFAFKIEEVNAEAPANQNLLAQNNTSGYVISKANTFIKVSLGTTEVPATGYNGENKGTLITEGKSCTNNHNVSAGVWGFAIKDMLNQNTNDLTVDLVPDGFLQSSNTDDNGNDTDSNKNFLKLNAGYFQNRSNQVEVSFSGLEWAAKLTVIKTETGTGLNFKNVTSFNDCNENTERPCVAKDTVFDFGTSTNVVKYITANTIYLALPGTKSLVEGGTASATSLSVSVPGFIRQSVNVTLKKNSQLTVEFDGDTTGDSETKFSGDKLQFKAKITKIIARSGASSFADVTTSVGAGNFATVSNLGVNGTPILSGGVYYIPLVDAAANSSYIRKFRINSVTLVVNGVVTVYSSLDVDVSSAFNTPNQVTIEIAKSGGTGTEFCSSTATICSNSIIDFKPPEVEFVGYSNTQSLFIIKEEGTCTLVDENPPQDVTLFPEVDIVRAGENFEIRFTYKDSNGFAPQVVKIKFDLNENGEFENETLGDIVKTFTGASIEEVDPTDSNIKDGKVYKVRTSLPFRKNTKLSDTNGGRGNIDRIFLGNIGIFVDEDSDGVCDDINEDGESNRNDTTIKFIKERLAPAITATASSGLESDEVSATKPLVVRDNDPTLTGATVTPSSGNPGQQFTFEVTYTDADNNPPKLLYLWIDLNGDGKEDPATEYFSVTKKDINDNDYTNGAVYQAKVTLNEARTYTAKFFASDGFICGTSGYTLSDVNNFTSTQKTYLCSTNSPDKAEFEDIDGDGFNDSTNGTNIVYSDNINFTVNLPAGFTQEDAPSIDFVGVSGFTGSEGGVANSCRGAVEPDGGTNFQSGSKVVIAVKYTSPKNRAPQTIKAYLDYGPNADGVSDPAEIVSLTKATTANVDSWANVSSSVKTAVKAVTTLFDGSYTNGELYYAEVQAFGPAFRILRVVANDGVQVGTKAFVLPTGTATCVTLVFTDLDGDGIDDNLEDAETVSNPQKVTLALNNYDSGKDLKVKVAVEALSGGSSAPTFAGGTRAVILENAAGFGTLSFPDENLSVLGGWILNVAVANPGDTVRFTITLPSPLPIGAKIFKTDASNAWFDITSSVSISSDRKTIAFTATDGSPFDTDPTPGAIGDPIGIFIPGGGEGQIFGGGAGGGGGCFVNPKFNRGTGNFDGGIFVLVTTLGLYALYRLFAKAKKANI